MESDTGQLVAVLCWGGFPPLPAKVEKSRGRFERRELKAATP